MPIPMRTTAAHVECVAGKPSCGDKTTCDGQGVALDKDPSNCGVCGRTVGFREVCYLGTPRCEAEFSTRCDGTCVNLNTDRSNCGQCGKACPTDPTGQHFYFCQRGTCERR